MSIELKIKSKTLAAESRIIKDEAHKLKTRARKARDRQKSEAATGLSFRAIMIRNHAKNVVRPEARATFLARAALRGLSYQDVEGSCKDPVPEEVLKKAGTMVSRYGGAEFANNFDIEEWVGQ